MTFAASMQRLNASMSRVCNAAVLIDGATVSVPCVYDNGYAVAMDAMGVQRPSIGLTVADAGAVDADSTVQIVGGPAYTVQTAEPDGMGWIDLSLRLAA